MTDRTTSPRRLVFCLRRRPELTRDEFQSYWLDRHAPLVAERAPVLGIARYRQMHTVRGAAVGDPFDGIAELFIDRSARTADLTVLQQAGDRLLEDEREFIDLERSPIWRAAEEQITPGPEHGVRVTAVVRSDRTDLDVLRRRLERTAAQGRSSTLLHAPTGREPDQLAVARRSPDAFPLMIEAWIGESGIDTATGVDEMSEHLISVDVAPDDQLIWCARSHPIVGAD